MTAHDERVGQPRDTETETALGHGLLLLRQQRIVGDIDDIVEKTHSQRHQGFEASNVELRPVCKRFVDQTCKIDRTQEASAIRRKGLFATGIGGRNLFAIAKVILGVDAIDEDHTRLGVRVGRTHHAIPQRAGLNGAVDLAVEDQVPGLVLPDGLDEGVGDENRQIEIAEPDRIGFGVDEVFNVGMIAAQGGHHGPATGPGGHDGAAHGIPDFHEADGARCIGADALHQRAARPQRGKVMADAASLLHRQCRFLDVLEDGAEVVIDAA